MTQQDSWRPELARMAQRQDQVERQHRETTTRVDALNRDVEFRIDSLRREMDRQFRDRDWRVSSLERSRDTYENLFWFSMPLVAAVAVIIVLVIAVVASPGATAGARAAFTLIDRRSYRRFRKSLATGFHRCRDTFSTTSPPPVPPWP